MFTGKWTVDPTIHTERDPHLWGRENGPEIVVNTTLMNTRVITEAIIEALTEAAGKGKETPPPPTGEPGGDGGEG